MKKIYILGSVGSGKTYLADKLSRKLKIKKYNLDDIFWKKKYTTREKDSIRRRKLDKLVNKREWIIEGIWTDWTSKAIKKSDIIIWLQTPYYLRSFRMFNRYLREKSKKENNSFKKTLKLIRYSGRYMKEIDEDYSAGYHSHKKLLSNKNFNVFIIRNGKQLKKFLENL